MALVLANRVQETGTANTTVSFTLTGAVTGFQSFTVIGNTNTTFYSATDTSGNWEVGLGTYSTTGPTLTRTTIYASSNSGSAVTFVGAVNVFVTYPSGKSVNLDGSGNVSALGTVASGTWQGSTIGVAYGGTGVTASTGPNSVVLRDANENITVNRLNQGLQTITASGGTTVLTAASDFNQALVGTGGQTFQLPDATTLTDTTTFQFNNNATGTLTITDYASATVGTVASGGAAGIALLNNATVGGTWDVHAYIPENVTWGTNSLYLNSTIVTGGTWQGGTIQSGYGGTGLTTFTGANNALYSTGASTLTAGTLPVLAGGTGATTAQTAMNTFAGAVTSGSYLRGNGTNVVMSTIQAADVPTLNQNTTGTASNVTGTVAIANGGSGQTTAQTAMNAFAGAVTSGSYLRGNGTNVVMATIQAADVPTLNQNTTGTASNVTGTVAIANGGTGQTAKTAAFDALSPLTTKGDLIGFDGTDNVRVAVGTNGYVLTADSSAASGVSWAAGGGGSGATISNDTTTATTLYPLFAAATSGSLANVYTSNAKYLYQPSTGELQSQVLNASNGIFVNSATVTVSYTVPAGSNAGSFGPVTIASGITVTVPSGSVWTVT
jgi:hypothetical protein